MQPFILSVYTIFHSWVQWSVTKSKVAKMVPHSTLELVERVLCLSSIVSCRLRLDAVFIIPYLFILSHSWNKKCAYVTYTKCVLVLWTKESLRVHSVPKHTFTFFIAHSIVLTVLLQVDRYIVAEFSVESYTSETSAECYSPTLWGLQLCHLLYLKMEWDNQAGINFKRVYFVF